MVKFNSNPNQILLSANIQADSVVDGPGIRTVIWTQGCIHNCTGCHNPETHSFNNGKMVNINEVCQQIECNHQDITFSGGDPFLQAEQCAQIAQHAKTLGLTVWAYTGFTFEYLLSSNDDGVIEFLFNIDVLVDGRFEIENKSLECAYRGSTNQRLIDVQTSLKTKRTIHWNNPYALFESPAGHNLI